MAYSEKWIKESPVIQGERESIPYSLLFSWATTATVDDSSLIVYKGNEDVTSSVTTGSNTYSGNIVTLKTLTGLTGGQTYVLSILVTVDGVQDEYKMEVYCASSYDDTRGRWVIENPVVQGERAIIPYSLSFSQATTISVDADTALKVYRGTTDVTSTVTSGSNIASGRVVTLKNLYNLKKGTYVCSVLATVDGIQTEVKFKVFCFSSD